MKVKHFSIFNVNPSKEINWNNLRDEELELPYYLPDTREKYLLKVDVENASKTVLAMIDRFQKLGYFKLLSLGSGNAQTEYQIKKYSKLEVIVSDNTNSIERLKTYNIFNDVLSIDILKDDFPLEEKTIVLLHRIDTEFDDNELKLIFNKLKNTGVKHICFVPTNPFALNILLNEFKTLVLSILKFKRRTFCGYSRSKSSLIKLWNNSYKLTHELTHEKTFYILELHDSN